MNRIPVEDGVDAAAVVAAVVVFFHHLLPMKMNHLYRMTKVPSMELMMMIHHLMIHMMTETLMNNCLIVRISHSFQMVLY
jgi:hypothetical protein